MKSCYVFDIDGTIADLSHRLHHIQGESKNWDAFFAGCEGDAPIPHIIELAQDLARGGGAIIYVSGRSDQCRKETSAWLGVNNLPIGRLYMRKAGDHRPDNIVKGELLDKLMNDGWQPRMAFDDRNQVVQMWRAKGVPCAQVAEGDF